MRKLLLGLVLVMLSTLGFGQELKGFEIGKKAKHPRVSKADHCLVEGKQVTLGGVNCALFALCSSDSTICELIFAPGEYVNLTKYKKKRISLDKAEVIRKGIETKLNIQLECYSKKYSENRTYTNGIDKKRMNGLIIVSMKVNKFMTPSTNLFVSIRSPKYLSKKIEDTRRRFKKQEQDNANLDF